MNEASAIQEMLGEGGRPEGRVIAVVGLSADPAKPSHSVSAYMQAQGYRILPVNPSLAVSGERVLGEKSYPSLVDLPERPDVVNVFRLPKEIPAIVTEMQVIWLENLWVQQGIVNPEAAHRAETAGIRVVMDRCIMVEHRRSKRQGSRDLQLTV